MSIHDSGTHLLWELASADSLLDKCLDFLPIYCHGNLLDRNDKPGHMPCAQTSPNGISNTPIHCRVKMAAISHDDEQKD